MYIYLMATTYMYIFRTGYHHEIGSGKQTYLPCDSSDIIYVR